MLVEVLLVLLIAGVSAFVAYSVYFSHRISPILKQYRQSQMEPEDEVPVVQELQVSTVIVPETVSELDNGKVTRLETERVQMAKPQRHMLLADNSQVQPVHMGRPTMRKNGVQSNGVMYNALTPNGMATPTVSGEITNVRKQMLDSGVKQVELDFQAPRQSVSEPVIPQPIPQPRPAETLTDSTMLEQPKVPQVIKNGQVETEELSGSGPLSKEDKVIPKEVAQVEEQPSAVQFAKQGQNGQGTTVVDMQNAQIAKKNGIANGDVTTNENDIIDKFNVTRPPTRKLNNIDYETRMKARLNYRKQEAFNNNMPLTKSERMVNYVGYSRLNKPDGRLYGSPFKFY